MTAAHDNPAPAAAPEARPPLERLVSVPSRRPGTPARAAGIEGVDGTGTRLRVRLTGAGRPSLLLFLGAACDGCLPFWPAVVDPESLGLAPGDGVVVVTRAPPHEDPARLRTAVPTGARPATLVLSDAAWRDYRVQGPPFFVLVEGGIVVTEGVAWSVGQVAEDVRRARRKHGASEGRVVGGGETRGADN